MSKTSHHYPPAAKRAYERDQRRRRKAKNTLHERPLEKAGFVERFQKWAERLIIPLGHRDVVGKRFKLQQFQLDFLKEVIADEDIKLGVLSVPRKNAKTMLLSLYLLFCLLFEREYFYALVAAPTAELTQELKRQIEALCTINKIEHVTVYASPTPGKVTCGTRTLQFLATDRKTTGHSKGADMVVIDELGRFTENNRTVINALRQALAISNGPLYAISPQYDSPFMYEFREVAKVESDHKFVEFKADVDDDPFDEATWYKANPGLGTIKSVEYMRRAARDAQTNEANLPDFLAAELNLPYSPEKQMICAVQEWKNIYAAKPLENEPVFLGIDLGGSASMTAACAIGSNSGRMRFWGAWGDYRSLTERGRADGVGNRYEQMYNLEELRLYQGRLVQVGAFIRDVLGELAEAGCDIIAMGADRYRADELSQVMDEENLWRIPVDFRPVGSGPDGSADIRAFQKNIHTGKISCQPSLLMESALASATLKYTNNNPSLERATSNSRIDIVSAAVIAVGMFERNYNINMDIEFNILRRN